MADRKPNEVKLIAWHLVAKNLVKFVNDDKSYKLTDKVIAANDFTKYPLSKGTSVEVGIVDDTITYLRKQKSEAKAETHGSEEAYEPTAAEEAGTVEPEKPKAPAPAEANPPIVDGGVRELTVFAVAVNKKVVKFLEVKDAGWFQIDEAIQAQDYAVIGLQAKNKGNVLIVENKVISFQKVASEPAEQAKTAPSSPANAKVEPTAAPAAQAPVQAPKKEWKPYNSNESDARQKSIECQACMNSACEIAGQVAAAIANASRNVDKDGNVTTNAPTANIINRMIRAIAEENYSLLQELKSK
jgi:hypothetical protein